MTKQEAFDRIITHLAKQKVKSQNSIGQCLYRGPNERKCAIGVLLSDELATSFDSKEGAFISGFWDRAKGELALSDASEHDSQKFYIRMQDAHDTTDSAEQIQTRLRTVAANYYLDPSLITTITKWAYPKPRP